MLEYVLPVSLDLSTFRLLESALRLQCSLSALENALFIMTTGDVVYSPRFSLIKIFPEPGFELRSPAGESSVLTARLHMPGV